MLKPISRMHLRCASMSSSQFSWPFSTIHASRRRFVSGHAQHALHLGGEGVPSPPVASLAIVVGAADGGSGVELEAPITITVLGSYGKNNNTTKVATPVNELSQTSSDDNIIFPIIQLYYTAKTDFPYFFPDLFEISLKPA